MFHMAPSGRFALLLALIASSGEGLRPAERGEPIRSIRFDKAPSIAEFWKQVYQPALPVLLKGLVSGTPMMEAFSSEGLRNGPFSKYDHRVSWRRGHGEGPRNKHSRVQPGWKFADIEAWLADQAGMKTGGPVMGGAISQEPLGQEDVMRSYLESLPASFWLPAYEVQPSLWVNFNATAMVSGLHFDPYDNFFIAIEGKKSFQVFPYSQGDLMQPDESYHSYSQQLYSIFALAGLDADSLRQRVLEEFTKDFPGYAEAEGALVELEPGDMFYLPSGYWHAGIHDDHTIGISFWWLTLCPHERVFEFWMRQTPNDNDDDEGHKLKLPPGYGKLKFPPAPDEDALDQEDSWDTGDENTDLGFLAEERERAGCYRSEVGTFKEFAAKLAVLGDQATCILAWYKKSWSKLGRLARKPRPTSREGYETFQTRVTNTAWSLQETCDPEFSAHTWSYLGLMKRAFPGCEGDGCEQSFRTTVAALRSIMMWEPCSDKNEL